MFLFVSWVFGGMMLFSAFASKVSAEHHMLFNLVYSTSFYALLIWCTVVFYVRVHFVFSLRRWRKDCLFVEDVISRVYAMPHWRRSLIGAPSRAAGSQGGGSVLFSSHGGDGGASISCD